MTREWQELGSHWRCAAAIFVLLLCGVVPEKQQGQHHGNRGAAWVAKARQHQAP